MLFFRPYFFDVDILYQKLYVKNKKTLKIFAILYVFFASVAIYYSLNLAIDNINSGVWGLIRNQLYQDDIVLYTSQFERIAKIFSGYLNPLAIVLFFYYLANNNTKKIWLIIFGIAIIAPISLTAINTASRGLLVNIALSLFLGYVIFRKAIPRNITKGLIIISSAA
jgi:hypothetical protein